MGNQSIYTADSFCLCINKTRFAMATEMVQKAMDNEAENTKPVQDDTKPVQDDTKPVQDDAKPVQDDAKPVQDDAKPVQDDAKLVQDDAKLVQDDAKPVQDDAKDTKRVKGDKKRKNSNASSAVEKKGKKTMRAWLIDGACATKQDIKCFDLEMSDPFQQIKKNYFTPQTTLQTVIIDYKQKGRKTKNMTFCFDEEGMYTSTRNALMGGICHEIWPDTVNNPFSHGAFGSYVMYYAGSTSGAPCSDMPPVETIDDFIECLCESNE